MSVSCEWERRALDCSQDAPAAALPPALRVPAEPSCGSFSGEAFEDALSDWALLQALEAAGDSIERLSALYRMLSGR